mgnify:FL=1
MATYKTAEVAAMIGVHPNTVRLYEKMKLIPNRNGCQMVIAYLQIFIYGNAN